MCEEKPYAAAAQNARRRGRLWGPRGRTADTAMRTLWTAAPVARVLGRGGAASASTSARGGSSDLARQKSDGTIDEDEPFFDAGAPRVGRVDAWRELGFSSAREMREQHGSDLHRHNRRRLRAGRAPVTEAEFLQKNEDGDLSSISGSDENDATDSDHSGSDEDAEHASVSRHAEKFRASKGAGEGAQMVVEAEDGSKFGVWRCLVFPPGRDVNAAAARDALVALQRIEASDRKPWVVILARGGHFAASAFEPGKFFFPKDKGKGDDEKAPLSERFLNELVPASAAVAHKTFHRYVVRAKAGGRQSGKDGGGKTIKSAGSSIRRANEAALEKEIKDLFLNDERWASIVASAALIFVSASKTDTRTLFGGADAPLRRDDLRVRRVPFATRRPTFNETRRVVGKLSVVNFDVVREEVDEVTRDEETNDATEETSTLTSAQLARLEAAKARAAEAAAALGSLGLTLSEGDADGQGANEVEVEVVADTDGRPALSKKEKEKLKKKRAKERAREKAAEENANAAKTEETETTTTVTSPSPEPQPKQAFSSGGGKGGKAAALLAKARQNQTAKRDEAVRDGPSPVFFFHRFFGVGSARLFFFPSRGDSRPRFRSRSRPLTDLRPCPWDRRSPQRDARRALTQRRGAPPRSWHRLTPGRSDRTEGPSRGDRRDGWLKKGIAFLKNPRAVFDVAGRVALVFAFLAAAEGGFRRARLSNVAKRARRKKKK